MEPPNPAPSKQEVYGIAAAIQHASGHRLAALPCEEGNGIAVSNGDSIWFIEPTEVSTPEAMQAHVTRWLNTSPAPQSRLSKDATASTQSIIDSKSPGGVS
ncbi:MAG: hypothetical protein L0387_42660 [Acidobacteria bacterium]|nr:hypothetical protein [Acidobacteriota bacterium]MCI0721988.1 hypothetical protein [Acidobacteriota bacterium]